MDHSFEHPNGSGHEHREANLRLIVLSGAGVAVAVFISLLLMWGVFNLLKVNQQNALKGTAVTPSSLAPALQYPPSPRIEEHPSLEYPEERAYEDKILSTYGWENKEKGVVHIPVDRAMDILAQKGIPGGHNPLKPAPGAANQTGSTKNATPQQ